MGDTPKLKKLYATARAELASCEAEIARLRVSSGYRVASGASARSIVQQKKSASPRTTPVEVQLSVNLEKLLYRETTAVPLTGQIVFIAANSTTLDFACKTNASLSVTLPSSFIWQDNNLHFF